MNRLFIIILFCISFSINEVHSQTKEYLFGDTVVEYIVFRQSLENMLKEEYGISNLSQVMDSVENKLAKHCDLKKEMDVVLEYNSYLGGSEMTCLCTDYSDRTIVLWYNLYEDTFKIVDMSSKIKFDFISKHELIYEIESIGSNTKIITLRFLKKSNEIYQSSVIIR